MDSDLTLNSHAAPVPTLRDIAAVLFGRWRILAGSLVVLLLVLITAAVVSPRYESHFKVLLRRGRSEPMISPDPTNVVDLTHADITEEELNSEVELLRDADLLKAVVRQAGLIPTATTNADREAEIEHAARRLASRLAVEPVKKSNLIQVNYRDTDPAQSARILTALATLYVRKHTSLHRPSGEVEFFTQQTAETERLLQASEADLVHFTQSRGVVSADLERDIALQKLGEAEASYRQIDQELVETDKKISALREQLASFPSRSVTLKRWADNAMLLEKMKSHLLDLQLRRTELLTRFEPGYRLVQEVDREIEEARAAIAAEALTPVRDETTDKDPNYEWARMELEKAEVEAKGLRARQADAGEQIESLHARARLMQADAVDQHSLARQSRAKEDNYLLYLRKLEEARIGDALDARRILNVAIVEPPAIPVLPVHPFLFYLALAAGAAMALSIATVFLAEYFDPTIRTPQEARLLLAAPVLAWLPDKGAESARPAAWPTGIPRTVDE